MLPQSSGYQGAQQQPQLGKQGYGLMLEHHSSAQKKTSFCVMHFHNNHSSPWLLILTAGSTLAHQRSPGFQNGCRCQTVQLSSGETAATSLPAEAGRCQPTPGAGITLCPLLCQAVLAYKGQKHLSSVKGMCKTLLQSKENAFFN